MKLSVIMPAYNAEKYLAEAIESVLSQTFNDFEFILANDGSSDATLSIMNYYKEKDQRIIIIDSPDNLGVGRIFNKSVALSKGEWIARIDADDIMLPTRLEEQMDYLSSNSWVDVVSCWAYYINHKSNVIGKLIYPTDLTTEEDNKKYMLDNQVVHILQPGVIMRKEAFLSVNGYKHIMPSEDIDLWNRLIEKGYIISCMHKILMKYRIHNNSMTTKNYVKALQYDEWIGVCMKLRRQGKAEITFEDFSKQIKQKPFPTRFDRWRKLYANYTYRNAAHLYGEQNYLGFLFNVACSFVLDPYKFLGRLVRQL
jgi:glycosyltransferase involved in cell wall biosynthesis